METKAASENLNAKELSEQLIKKNDILTLDLQNKTGERDKLLAELGYLNAENMALKNAVEKEERLTLDIVFFNKKKFYLKKSEA